MTINSLRIYGTALNLGPVVQFLRLFILSYPFDSDDLDFGFNLDFKYRFVDAYFMFIGVVALKTLRGGEGVVAVDKPLHNLIP